MHEKRPHVRYSPKSLRLAERHGAPSHHAEVMNSEAVHLEQLPILELVVLSQATQAAWLTHSHQLSEH